jgi:hypothetical protein
MDGRNVRIRETYKTNPQRKVFSSFLYWPAGTKEGTIQRSRYVATDEEARRLNEWIPLDEGVISIEHLKSEQMSGFLQNYLGIPDLWSQKYVQAEDILPMKIPSKKVPRNELDYIAIGIDPAFSTKTASDAIGIVVMWFHTIKTEDEKTRRKKYTLKGVALEWEEKRQTNFVAVVKAMYQNYHVSRITIEWNNGGSILAEQLKAEWLAVDVVNASKDKVTRFKEQERDLQNGNIYFVEWETEGLIAELLDFTGEDWKQDNLADAFVYSLYDKKFTFWVSGENDPEPEPEIEEDDR